MNKGEHKTVDGLLKIISLRASLKVGLSTALKIAFPNVIPAVIPTYNVGSELQPHFIAGFLSAEANFFISLYEQDITVRKSWLFFKSII